MNPFLERYKELGEEFNPDDVVIKEALRINTLKISFDGLSNRKKARLTKIPFLDNGYYYNADFSLGSTSEFFQGYYYLQETASQIPVEVLDPKSGDLILDMCAAPGSKTTHLSMLMKNKGQIVALDSNAVRLPSLKNNIERCDCRNILVYRKDARYAEDLNLKFDRILLDAPCSGNFANDEGWFEKRTVEDFKIISKTQKQLLDIGIELLKSGGTIVYSTCSLEPEENEMVIDWLLKKRDDVKLEVIDKKVGDSGLTNVFGNKLNFEVAKCKRLWPHKTNTQGFFIAKIRKK